MKNAIIPFVVIGIVVLGCKEKSNQSVKENKIDTSHFFQIAVIFQKDLKEIDATPYFIYKIEKINDKKDQVFLIMANMVEHKTIILKMLE